MVLGLFLVFFFAFIAIFASYLDKAEGPGNINPFVRLQAPDSEHWFGTDLMGRDVYSRTLHGSRLSLAVGGVVAFIVMAAGAFIGVPAGYFRMLDNIIMRFMDGLMAFPSFLLAIALVAILGPSFKNVVIALSVTGMPGIVRIVRGSVLSLREAQYVEAARALGANPLRVLTVHIFPQVVAPLVVGGTFIFAGSILTEAGLSFLGTGIPPITPSWGNMMGESKIYANISVWTLFFPGLMIALTVLGVNLVGDGLRDALDPKLRRRQ
ncbi:MAG: ABC transporter permease [Chloroflexi bacterium]|nr:ABC transporter permease [Chloroflexota bacterium]